MRPYITTTVIIISKHQEVNVAKMILALRGAALEVHKHC